MAIIIERERPDSPEARVLINELSAYLHPLSPPESQHGYSIEKLLARSVNFFIVRADGEPAACGGIEYFGDEYGEVKRMYVRPRYRGQGLGKLILRHLSAEARGRGIAVLRLETGSMMKDAIALYEGYGFKRIPNFGEYKEDPLSTFLELRLD